MQECTFETNQVFESVVYRWIWICVCLTLATVAHAQGTVKGFLKAEASGEAVMFASVTLEGTNYGVSSDVSGYFSLSRIPSGQYTLVVTSLEYETVREVVSITDGRVLTRNLLLKTKVVIAFPAVLNDTIIVSNERDAASRLESWSITHG